METHKKWTDGSVLKTMLEYLESNLKPKTLTTGMGK